MKPPIEYRPARQFAKPDVTKPKPIVTEAIVTKRKGGRAKVYANDVERQRACRARKKQAAQKS